MMALACCCCAGRPLEGVIVPTAETAEGASRVQVLIATTRQRSEDAGEMFGSDNAVAMSYGRINISIPPKGVRKIGAIQWPVSPPGNPGRDFVTVSAEHLDRPGFSAALTTATKATRRSTAMIFVHGFSNRFDDAAYRLAQIIQDSGAPVVPVLFSWPSQGVASLRAYKSDGQMAGQSSEALDQLIDAVALNPNVGAITVLCHSMGCVPTLEALRARSQRTGRIGAKIKNVLLVAPDVDAGGFPEQMRQMGSARPRFALFLSKDDHALKISKSIAGGATRLGDVDAEEEPYKSALGREKILVFDLTHLQGRPHSRAFDSATTVMGMIERRLADGQDLAEDTSRVSSVGQ